MSDIMTFPDLEQLMKAYVAMEPPARFPKWIVLALNFAINDLEKAEALCKELADRLVRMEKALRAVEWKGDPEEFDVCPLCRGYIRNGHNPGCLIGEALEGCGGERVKWCGKRDEEELEGR